MKKLILIVTVFSLFLSGCTGVKSTSSGLENEAFLEFIGDPDNYKNGVDVVINDNPNFTANVYKDHKKRPKGIVYAIPTGKHLISISYENNVIYKKQIFVSAQETKKIMLP